MNCTTHSDRPVLGLCGACDQFVCELDSNVVDGILYCRGCADRVNKAKRTETRSWRLHRRGAPRAWRPFEKARELARGLGLRNVSEWRRFAKGELPGKTRPADIPTDPQVAYRRSWTNWGDWLGTGTVAPRDRRYRSFEEARAFARSLGLDTWAEWIAFATGRRPDKGVLPADVPAGAAGVYRDEWRGVGDWLGTGRIASTERVYRSFEEARAFVRGLGLKNQSEWTAFAKGALPEKGTLPPDIPHDPVQAFKSRWKGLGDWLGTGNIAPSKRRFRPFEEARAFVRRLGLRTTDEWWAYSKGAMPRKGKRPADVPGIPSRVYRDQGWVDYDDWLGVPPFRVTARPFVEARDFARSLGLETAAEWRSFSRGRLPAKGTRPKGIPAHPDRVYEEWKGWPDWLGVEP